MYIIDKNKDFYDFYSKIYGIDKAIVFDRRGSNILGDSNFEILLSFRGLRGCVYLLLEVGFKQYLIEYSNIKTKYDKFSCIEKVVSYNIRMVRTFNENKHLFAKEITLVGVDIPYYYNFGLRNFNLERLINSVKLSDLKISMKHIELPILANTKLTTFLDAKEIWKDLSTFISSKKNDKNVDIVNTDKDKIVIHGFDVKTSFRHPVK
jgi:hypothetical protein